MLHTSSRVITATCFGLLLSASTAAAKTPNVLSIADCAGKTRLTQQLEDGQSVSVVVKVQPVVGEQKSAILLKEKTQETVASLPQAKDALVFQGIQGGNWMVCDENKQKIAFGEVAILDAKTQTSSALKQGGIIGASVASVGAAAVALSDSSSSGSGSSAGRDAASAFGGGSGASSAAAATDDRAVIPGTTFDPDTDDDNFSFGDEAEPVSPFQ